MRLQAVAVGDLRRRQQLREQERSRGCVGEGVVRLVERNPVPRAELDQAVRVLALRIERTGQTQRAQAGGVRRRVAGAAHPAAEERPVEADVVAGHDRTLEPADELGDDVTEARRLTQIAPGEAVHPRAAADAGESARTHQGRPTVEHGAVGPDPHDRHLQHLVATGGQPVRLDVDHCELGVGEHVRADRGFHASTLRRG
jgi:hypothetical protein